MLERCACVFVCLAATIDYIHRFGFSGFSFALCLFLYICSSYIKQMFYQICHLMRRFLFIVSIHIFAVICIKTLIWTHFVSSNQFFSKTETSSYYSYASVDVTFIRKSINFYFGFMFWLDKSINIFISSLYFRGVQCSLRTRNQFKTSIETGRWFWPANKLILPPWN